MLTFLFENKNHVKKMVGASSVLCCNLTSDSLFLKKKKKRKKIKISKDMKSENNSE